MIGRPLTVRPADNPFASRRIDALAYRFSHGGVEETLDRLSRHGGRGCIVGPHGSGKTSLLEHLAERLEGRLVWVRLDTGRSNPLKTVRASLPGRLDQRHTILLDGAEQLGPLAWLRFHRRARHARTIVVTSHRPGRLPTIHECTTDPGLLTELVGELAPAAVETVDLAELFERHDGNVRLCLRELYDRWAGRGTHHRNDRR